MAVWESAVVPKLNNGTGVYEDEDHESRAAAEELPKAKRIKGDSETESMDKQIDASYSGMHNSRIYLQYISLFHYKHSEY